MGRESSSDPTPIGPIQRYAYAADALPGSNGDRARKDSGIIWCPSIYMPRVARHVALKITGVRAERLQEISEPDSIAESLERGRTGAWLPGPCGAPAQAFQLYGMGTPWPYLGPSGRPRRRQPAASGSEWKPCLIRLPSRRSEQAIIQPAGVVT